MTPGPLGGPVRVLVADDDPDIRQLVELAVSRAGLELVASVGTGTAALAAIREHRPSLAVLDVAMPGMTGLEVCAAVRADPAVSGMRLLLLSASVHGEAMQAGGAAGADDYLPKPFRVKELAERIGGAVGVR
jgi:DNA-binding response OmpR family regulator